MSVVFFSVAAGAAPPVATLAGPVATFVPVPDELAAGAASVAEGGGGMSPVFVGAVFVAGIWITTGAGCGTGRKNIAYAATPPKLTVKSATSQNQSGTPWRLCWGGAIDGYTGAIAPDAVAVEPDAIAADGVVAGVEGARPAGGGGIANGSAIGTGAGGASGFSSGCVGANGDATGWGV